MCYTTQLLNKLLKNIVIICLFGTLSKIVTKQLFDTLSKIVTKQLFDTLSKNIVIMCLFDTLLCDKTLLFYFMVFARISLMLMAIVR